MALEFLNKIFGAARQTKTAVAAENAAEAEAASPAGQKTVEEAASLSVHPLDDPDVWLRHPCHQPPVGVDIKREQASIDSIVGVTGDNQSIVKAIWAGDVRYWLSFYMSWDCFGQPNAEPVLRPLVIYKKLRGDDGKLIRDVFPARWLLVSRLEPEQYHDTWRDESLFFAPEIHGFKLVRPIEPPKEFWLLHSVVARHTDYCCATAEKDRRKCYGTYAPPSFALNQLGEQKRALEKSGFKTSNPFEKVDANMTRDLIDENTAYYEEIAKLEIERRIYSENPMALLGVTGSMSGKWDGKEGEQLVKDFYDKEIERVNKKIKR